MALESITQVANHGGRHSQNGLHCLHGPAGWPIKQVQTGEGSELAAMGRLDPPCWVTGFTTAIGSGSSLCRPAPILSSAQDRVRGTEGIGSRPPPRTSVAGTEAIGSHRRPPVVGLTTVCCTSDLFAMQFGIVASWWSLAHAWKRDDPRELCCLLVLPNPQDV
jgi:hypothetical protein